MIPNIFSINIPPSSSRQERKIERIKKTIIVSIHLGIWRLIKKYLDNTKIITVPIPYIGVNGPYIMPLLKPDFVIKASDVSKIYPKNE